jgi:hypothetical protein
MLARERPGAWLSALSAAGPGTGGFAVAVAWATLALVGRWEPEASWVDRLGRALGAGWIAMAAFRACVLMGP